jgi:hypothetical protein
MASLLDATRVRRGAGPIATDIRRAGVVVALAAVVTGAAVYSPRSTLVVAMGCVAVGIVAGVAVRPVLGAYLVFGVTPLLAGIDRGALIPALRPSEAVAALVVGGLVTRGLWFGLAGMWRRPTIMRLDVAVVLLAVLSSVLPILWLAARGSPVAGDDALYALTLWKFVLIYVIARATVRTEREVRICLWISMVVAAAVAVIGILQAVQVGPVTTFLASHYAPYGNVQAVQNGRGGSTLSLPVAAADVLTFNLAIAIGFLAQGSRRRQELGLGLLSCLFLAGIIASGEFSGVIGGFIGLATAILVAKRVRLFLWIAPACALGVFALRSVIFSRLEGFQTASGLPVSWAGRIRNLTTYFWPQLSQGNAFLLGVRPSARVPVASQATGYVWIESGYMWLVWTGGLPLLGAFLWFTWRGIRRGLDLARSGRGSVAVVGLAAVTALIVVAVLMPLDPHLTYRGSAELLFGLLGLAGCRASRSVADR